MSNFADLPEKMPQRKSFICYSFYYYLFSFCTPLLLFMTVGPLYFSFLVAFFTFATITVAIVVVVSHHHHTHNFFCTFCIIAAWTVWWQWQSILCYRCNSHFVHSLNLDCIFRFDGIFRSWLLYFSLVFRISTFMCWEVVVVVAIFPFSLGVLMTIGI